MVAGVHLDNALRNLRVLARQAAVALDRGEDVPAGIPEALAAMGTAVDRLGAALPGDIDADPVRDLVIQAAAQTAGLSDHIPGSAPVGLFIAPMVAQVRLSASDLLQATGWSTDEAAGAIRAAADLG